MKLTPVYDNRDQSRLVKLGDTGRYWKPSQAYQSYLKKTDKPDSEVVSMYKNSPEKGTYVDM